MDLFIHWAGFAGAWLLVAGPLFQAAVELRDEDLDREQFERAKTDLPQQERISNWWWLLPPVAYFRNRRRNDEYQRAVMAALPATTREQFLGFMTKANGWFTVAAGAFLIALKETWELAEAYELPVTIYWIAIVVLSIAAVSNTVVRLVRADEMLHLDEPDYKEKRRAERATAMRKRYTKQTPPADAA
ncbi:MAG: hypothetical protein ABI632_07590 [Pseudolysinimonas sp.]